jgi:hypothetical protein
MLQQLKVNQPETVEERLSGVQHATFQRGRATYWSVINGFATVKAFCWLYCWIITTEIPGKAQAIEDARQIFNMAFNPTFEAIEVFNAANIDEWHSLVDGLREGEATEEKETQLAPFLPNPTN